jgi:photosystem II stability/assembly factor-like uncharacterized protein
MRLLLILLFLSVQGYAQTYTLKQVSPARNTSIRGLSVVSDQVAWVSGSKGYVGKSVDGGQTWEWTQPKGFESLDFRDIQAFDDQHAIIVNAGSPAFVLSTQDGGKSWSQQYTNADSLIFLDGTDFWDRQRGMIFGDPIKEKMQLLRTTDGGASWQDVTAQLRFKMKLGEAGFAASGTSIKTMPKGKVWIATGGSVSNVYYSKNYGKSWSKYPCPIMQGENSTGAFSIDFYDDKNGVVVGGNYLKDTDNSNNILITSDGGKTWIKPKVPVSGFRSAVAYLNKNTIIAGGSSGVDISSDAGQTWQHISDANINALGKSGHGSQIFLTGNKGEIYILSGQ